MLNQESNGQKRKAFFFVFWGVLAAVLVIAAAAIIIRSGTTTPEVLAERWVGDNVDAWGEEIAGFLSGQNPVLRELGGEYLEDRIHHAVDWDYSSPQELSPKGQGLWEITATATVDFQINAPLGDGRVRGSFPWVLRVDLEEEAVTESDFHRAAARVDLDLPIEGAGAKGVPNLVSAAPGDPDHSDCVAEARRDDNVDGIRVQTIEGTDPSSLTDAQRMDWSEFFRNKDSDLRRACVGLWSEPVTHENADRRNENFAGSRDQSGCITDLKGRVEEGDLWRTAEWADILELMERPYLSLTLTERIVLRERVEDFSDCREYYPQLFTGRWVPLREPR